MKRSNGGEAGQSLVLITLLIVLLLAFAGLATDVGMLFARSSQFSAAVDAATLAGVVELPDGLELAEQRAEEFLNANNWPIDLALSSNASESTTALGYRQLDYEVTYPVETYFLTLLGFDEIPISHSASAAIYTWADMPTATQAEQGILRTAGQYVYGPDSCTAQGDPVSARWRASGLPNPLRTETGGKYTYRIRIPDDYSQALEVQLFDPDSLNLRSGNTDGAVPGESCLSSGNGDSCFIPTGEDVSANPVWLRRMDETWRSGGAACPIREVNSPNGDTITRYDLFYIGTDGNRVELASFQSGASTDIQTDLQWVTPMAGDPVVPTVTGNFVIDSTTVGSLPEDQNEDRNIYLDVTAIAGTSRNGWDVWAGPPPGSIPADGNDRNNYILNNLYTDDNVSTEGVEIFALGYLPTASYHFDPNELRLPVAAIDQSLGGYGLSVSAFDFEGAGPLVYSFSTMSIFDWAYPSQDPPDALIYPECSGSADCNNKWIDPPINIVLPSREAGDAFYGGYLLVDYRMFNDEHLWHATLPLGRPFLTR